MEGFSPRKSDKYVRFGAGKINNACPFGGEQHPSWPCYPSVFVLGYFLGGNEADRYTQ